MRSIIFILSAFFIIEFTVITTVPPDLKSSKIYVVKKDFINWKLCIDTLPKGFDDYA